MFELEQHAVFWESLDEIEAQGGNPDLIGQVIESFARQILKDPYRVVPNAQGIFVVKSLSVDLDGRSAPAMRMAYTVTPGAAINGGDSADIITLLHVRAFDEELEFLETVPPADERPH